MNWPTVSFGDVLTDATGGNAKTKRSDYLAAGQFVIVDQGQSEIGGYTDDETSLCKVDGPVIIFGDHTKVLKYVDFPFCLGADGTKVLKPKSGTHPKYLFYALHRVPIPEAGYSRHFKYLKAGEIPLPPLEEQKRIAGILDQAAELCRLRTRALDKLGTLGQAIFHEMFGASLTEVGLSSLPALGDSLITVNNGLTRRAKTGAQSDAVLRLKDVRQGEIDFTDLSRITLTDKEKDKFRVNVGDLLFIRVNGNPDYVGRNAVFKGFLEDTYHNDHIMRVVLNRGALNPEFVSFVLASPFGRRQIRANMKTSAGQHTINQAGLSAIRIPMPPIESQEAFALRLSEIASRHAQFRRGVEEAETLFASLQHRAFRGEL